MKTCYRCKAEKEECMFDKASNTSSGFATYCKQCRSEERKSKSWKRDKHRKDAKERTHKPCTKCNKLLPVTEFHKRSMNLDGRDCRCKHCTRLNMLSRRDKNYESKVNAKDSIKLGFINLLGGRCISCGISPSDMWPVACFDFHHLSDKVERISFLMSRRTGLAYEELKKCVVLCSNCHRKEHKKISAEKRAQRMKENSHAPIYKKNYAASFIASE